MTIGEFVTYFVCAFLIVVIGAALYFIMTDNY